LGALAESEPNASEQVLRNAIKIAATLTSGGALQFPTVTALGGSLLGIPIIVSASTPSAAGSPPTDRHIILVDANQILVADAGGADIAVSDQASLEMDAAPTNDSGASPTGTSLVALYQTNSISYRTQREISWLKARTDAVAFMRVSY
jgi:hypothetical protein